MPDRVILWDFDGTLATRPGLWSACVIEVLDEHLPGHGITSEGVGPYLENGFPWHDWEQVRPGAASSDSWWDPILALIVDALVAVGIDGGSAWSAAAHFRQSFLDPARWVVYPDSIDALRLAAREGWSNVIVSNHVPELPDLVADLGLAGQVDTVFSSALHGYEKPHSEAFRIARRAAGNPEQAWMVGDNPIADIAGASQLGIPGVLVRVGDLDPDVVKRLESGYRADRFPGWQGLCHRRAETALDAVQIILNESPGAGRVVDHTA